MTPSSEYDLILVLNTELLWLLCKFYDSMLPWVVLIANY